MTYSRYLLIASVLLSLTAGKDSRSATIKNYSRIRGLLKLCQLAWYRDNSGYSESIKPSKHYRLALADIAILLFFKSDR